MIAAAAGRTVACASPAEPAPSKTPLGSLLAALRFEQTLLRQTLLRAAECWCTRLSRSGAPLDEPERAPLLALAIALRAHPPIALAEREWYEPVARRLHRVGRDLAILVARNSFANGCGSEATAIARQLSYDDPCDEEICELLICCQIRNGDPSGALASFRFHEAAVRTELSSMPSRHLLRLVEAEAGGPIDTGDFGR